MNTLDLSAFFQRFSSRALWHFTGYGKDSDAAYSVLESILSTSCLQVGKEAEMIIMHDGEKRWGYPFSCLCDIPFKDLTIHMVRYGQFGIAFHKHDAINHGHFNPILYLHKDAFLFQKGGALLRTIEGLVSAQDPVYAPLQEFLLALGSYTKRSDLSHPAEINPQKDKDQNNNFYYEREWRSVYPWSFNDESIAAIMMPSHFVERFRRKFGDRFPACSIISSEMVETL
jgi:hypothetical protein